MGVVSADQKRQFVDEGHLLLSGLVESEIVEAAVVALWRGLGADPNNKATWESVPAGSVHTDPDILACFTPRVLEAATDLADEEAAELKAPSSTFTLNIFPQDGPWKPHGPHIDHALERDGHRVFPRPLRVASILYLNDVPKSGAPTVVWPASHKKIEALARSDPDRYELMMTLNRSLGQLDLGEPITIPGKRGDILFYHYLTAHSGSINATDTPRLALVHKW